MALYCFSPFNTFFSEIANVKNRWGEIKIKLKYYYKKVIVIFRNAFIVQLF
jgi:hypothetical protein